MMLRLMNVKSQITETDRLRVVGLFLGLVPKNESLFIYSVDGYVYDSINGQNFVPTFIPSSTLESTVAPWCRSSKSCVREWIKTERQARAWVARDFEEGVLHSRIKLGTLQFRFNY